MNYFSVRDLRDKPGKVWESVEKSHEAIITNNGKPTFLMIGLNGREPEDVLASVRQAMAMKAVNNMRIGSAQRKTDALTDGQIEEEISAARREKKEP